MRKICFSSILFFIVLTSFRKENGFLITGHITGIPDSTQVMLQNISNGEYLDSSFVIKSSFTFSGKLNGAPEELRIISGLKELQKGNLFYTDLLIGNETVQVTGDISDMPLNINTTGSPVQKKAESYHKQLYTWNIKLGEARANLKLFPDSINTIKKTGSGKSKRGTRFFGNVEDRFY